MATDAAAGRIIGVLLLVQMAGGLLVNFVLMAPVVAAPGFLENAAAHSLEIALSVLAGLATGAVSLGIAITAFPVFRQHSYAMALWLVALAAASFALTAVEQMSAMSMLSLSEAYARASPADAGLFQALRITVASSRNWAHYIGLIVAGGMILVFYAVLFRFALIPRALAAFGLVAVILQITAVTMPLFGQSIVFPMLLPLALGHLMTAVWLIARGFRARAAAKGEQHDG